VIYEIFQHFSGNFLLSKWGLLLPQPFTHKETGCGGAAFFQQFWRLYHPMPKHRESGEQAPSAFLNCYYIYPDTYLLRYCLPCKFMAYLQANG